MTQEEKQLLLRDLCTRLPYGVICKSKSYRNILFDSSHISLIESEEIKPYLRPMSSMTEEEKEELLTLLVGEDAIGYFQVESNEITNTDEKIQFSPNWQYHWLNFSNENILLYVDWLNARHFDHRGLIDRGLALEAPKGLYKT